MRWIVVGALSLAVASAGCAGSGASGSPAPSSSPGASAGAVAGETSRPKPTPHAATPDPNNLGVKVTDRTKSVRRGGTASVTIKTAAKAQCGITVSYPSGPAAAKGLEPRTASSRGMVTWKWRVANDVKRGTWPVSVVCSLGARSGDAGTSVTVK